MYVAYICAGLIRAAAGDGYDLSNGKAHVLLGQLKRPGALDHLRPTIQDLDTFCVCVCHFDTFCTCMSLTQSQSY